MNSAVRRHCGKCGQDEPQVEFYESRKHAHICKGCTNTQRNAWREGNRERVRASERELYRKNPEKFKDSAKAQYSKNKNKVLERLKNRYEADPELFIERKRKWREDNPVQSSAQTRESQQRLRVESLPTAVRSGFQWTGWEMELAGDTGRSIKEVAKIIGRTYGATATMRHKVLNDPKWVSAAGLVVGQPASDDTPKKRITPL